MLVRYFTMWCLWCLASVCVYHGIKWFVRSFCHRVIKESRAHRETGDLKEKRLAPERQTCTKTTKGAFSWLYCPPFDQGSKGSSGLIGITGYIVSNIGQMRPVVKSSWIDMLIISAVADCFCYLLLVWIETILRLYMTLYYSIWHGLSSVTSILFVLGDTWG